LMRIWKRRLRRKMEFFGWAMEMQAVGGLKAASGVLAKAGAARNFEGSFLFVWCSMRAQLEISMVLQGL
jgi:hypothetical protein